MLNRTLRHLQRNLVVSLFLLLLANSASWRCAIAQAANESPYYARTNSFGVIAAYSPDSSRMILGVAERRKLWDFGASYSRRLLSGPNAIWQYDGELIPMALEGDPNSRDVIHETSPKTITYVYDGGPLVSCSPSTRTYSYTGPDGVLYSGVVREFCHGREWTIGEAVSPVGFQWNFMPRHEIQPLLSAHIGYMFSTKPIPIFNAGSFNFTFDVGGGFELYRAHSRSVRVQYRYHHISNRDSAYSNPGIDNGLVQLSYVFGR